MKVSELEYRRVTIEALRDAVTSIVGQIEAAESVEDVLAARKAYNDLMVEYGTMTALSYMRYTINTVDEFYLQEKDYYDEIGPEAANLDLMYNTAFMNSKFRSELEGKLNPLLFRSIENSMKSMSPEIVEDMVEENKLVSEYSALMAGMEFEFHGEKMSRAELMGYSEDDDRETRKECYEALGNTLMAHSEKLDRIFDDLVHVRDRMAKKMGYENFIELGYYRMNRISYNSELVAAFRENVKNNLVPVVAKLRNRVADDLGLDRVMLYDLGVIVPGGDPKPGDKDSIFAAAKEMYHDMSPITSAFIDMMMDNEAFDVEGRKNKWGGGYCTVFSKYRQPFILANFNGSNDDVDTMTHEVGHALNDYLTLDNEYIVELGCGGMETAETHSMGMEFFCWPYMEKFYGEMAAAYRYRHAVDSMSFIPYGTMVDAFQHIVYANPDLTPAQRNEAWLQLEKDYRPFLSMEGMPYLEKGTRWQYQMHIYETPFYYIDYCLAQTAAFQFLLASQENYDDAFAKYMKLSKQGGEKEWPELLKEAGFRSPFEEGALAEIAEKMEQLVMKIKV